MKNLKAVIWDFDGVWYDFNVLPDNMFFKMYYHTLALAVNGVMPNIKYADAINKFDEFAEKYGDHLGGFIQPALEKGMSEREFVSEVFNLRHQNLFNEISANHRHMLLCDKGLTSKFNKVAEHVDNMILSNASAEYWIKPVLSLRNQQDIVKSENIIGMDDFDFELKSKSDKGITLALGKLGYKPHEVLFVEDSPINLLVAKNSYPELNTALIGKVKKSREKYVDIVASSQDELLDVLISNIASSKVKKPTL